MLTFYHCPNTRSGSVLWLLEELGVPYDLQILDIRAQGGAPESYRAIQPNKKVPAIVHDGAPVHERAAIFATSATPSRPRASPRRSAIPAAGRIFPGWSTTTR